MKHNALLVILIFFANNINAQLPIEKIPENIKNSKVAMYQDSVFFYKRVSKGWGLDYCEKTTNFNENKMITEAVQYFYDENSNTWGFKKDTISKEYYENGNLKKYIKKPWNKSTNQWADTNYYIEYNNIGELKEMLYRTWMVNHYYFSYGYKDVYFHKENGKIDYYNDYYWWDGTGWIFSFKVVFYYDDNDYVIKKVNQKYENDSLVDDQQLLYTYNSSGLVKTKTRQVKNNGSWGNDERTSYFYNENNKTTKEIKEYYMGGSWHYFMQVLYTYNENGKLEEKLEQVDNNGTWQNNAINKYSYDENQNLVEACYLEWEPSTQEWIDNNKQQYFWSDHSQADFIMYNNDDFVFYPNPTSEFLFIKDSNCQNIKIYSIDGKFIESLNVHNSQVNVGNLQTGTYFFRTNTGISRVFIKR